MKVEVLLIETHARGARHYLEVDTERDPVSRKPRAPEHVDFQGYRYKLCGQLPETRDHGLLKRPGTLWIPWYQSCVKLA